MSTRLYKGTLLEFVAGHEAGHVVGSLASGGMPYQCCVRSASQTGSMGFISRYPQTPRQNAIASVSGCAADFITLGSNAAAAAQEFPSNKSYATDFLHFSKQPYSLGTAIDEAFFLLEEKGSWLELLSRNLQLSDNLDRVIEAEELFCLAGVEFLDSEKVPVPCGVVVAAWETPSKDKNSSFFARWRYDAVKKTGFPLL